MTDTADTMQWNFRTQQDTNERTMTKQTFTDSMILHPDDRRNTILTLSYGDLQMSSGFYDGYDFSRSSSKYSSKMDLSSRPSLSRISSRRDSVSSEFGYKSNQLGQYGTSTYSSNVGLAKMLNERPAPTHELSQSNLDRFTKQE